MPNPCPGRVSMPPSAQDDHADDAQNHAGDPPHLQGFLARHRHDGHREQRRGGIQDRSQPAWNEGLADHDQRERDDVIEQPDREERFPAQLAPGKADTLNTEQRQKNGRTQRDAQEHQRQRRQFPQRRAVEEERAAPEDREHGKQRPVSRVDPVVVRGHGVSHRQLTSA
ncbi:hypothetical protein ABIF42_004892 [Bradyrhizobium diazoefficiens]